MKVLLISANTFNDPYPVYPIGLDYVAGAIGEAHDVRIADMNTLPDHGSLGETIGGFSPDIIGVSLRNIDNIDPTDPKGFIGVYRDLIAAIRSRSRALIVLGGSGFTIFPDEAMDALDADYGIIGEGERLALLLDAIENRKDPAGIPGVVTRNLRKSFPPPWDGKFTRRLDEDRALYEFYLEKGGMMNLQTKRGCGFRCIYCTYPHIEGSRHRTIDPAEVADNALRLQGAGARYIFITDSVFNSDYRHNIAVARGFREAGLSIPWGAFFVPAKPPEDYFRNMVEAGLSHVEFGTDSLSDGVLKAYGKPFQVRDILDAHQAALDAGLHVAHYFLLGGPGEDTATIRETLSNVERLERSIFLFFCGMRIYPHTRLHDIAVREGQIPGGKSILEPVFYRSPIDSEEIIHRVKEQARGRRNWVIGSGGQESVNIIARLHQRGHIGPLWEYLIP